MTSLRRSSPKTAHIDCWLPQQEHAVFLGYSYAGRDSSRVAHMKTRKFGGLTEQERRLSQFLRLRVWLIIPSEWKRDSERESYHKGFTCHTKRNPSRGANSDRLPIVDMEVFRCPEATIMACSSRIRNSRLGKNAIHPEKLLGDREENWENLSLLSMYVDWLSSKIPFTGASKIG
jgi:hypothetical protein